MNGDSFINADLCNFVAHHKNSGADASLLCTEVDDASRYGCVEINSKNYISKFQEKNNQSKPGHISAGVYLFNPEMLARIDEADGPSLEHDVLQKMPAGSLHAMTGRFPFVDIGTPESLRTASDIILHR